MTGPVEAPALLLRLTTGLKATEGGLDVAVTEDRLLITKRSAIVAVATEQLVVANLLAAQLPLKQTSPLPVGVSSKTLKNMFE